jgi:hypothetical protein
MLGKAGATRFGVMTGEREAQIVFELDERLFRLTVAMPSMSDPYVVNTPTGFPRPKERQPAAWKQLVKIRWRTIALGIRSRLAEAEIAGRTVQDAFLGDVLLPSGRTVAEETRATIALAYRGREVPLLPGV